jgi:hypothetical protein
LKRDEQQPVALFLNGQRLLQSGYEYTGAFCFRDKRYLADYFQSGRNIENPLPIFDDVIVYDNYTDISVHQALIGSGTGAVAVANTGISFYLNGHRTQEYRVSGGYLYPPDWITTDDIWITDYHNSRISLYQTGNSAYMLVPSGFIAGTSRVFMNGQRLRLDQDYYEVMSGQFNTPATGSIQNTLVFDALEKDISYYDH